MQLARDCRTNYELAFPSYPGFAMTEWRNSLCLPPAPPALPEALTLVRTYNNKSKALLRVQREPQGRQKRRKYNLYKSTQQTRWAPFTNRTSKL